jgi:hypothetical protein
MSSKQKPQAAPPKKGNSLFKKLFIVGIVLPLSLLVFDLYIGPSKYYKETPLGILQPKLPEGVKEILDPQTGQLKHAGYGMDMEATLKVNY